MTPNLSVDEIVQRAVALGLLTSDQLQDVWVSLGTQNVEPATLMQALQRQGHLTKYQADRLASGETTGFYYGKYRVLYAAGAGTFARVFRAVDSETGKIAAVKVLRNRFSSDPEAVSLFEREAELGMQLRHPNIVSIYGVFSEQNSHYMVMDFIEGQTLRQYVNVHKKIEYKIATRITTDICTGLDYAFKRAHLHRDMKLTNVLVSSSGKALLLDFGLAADANDKGDQKNQRAIDYAVLERSTGVRRDDKRSDIYFLGAMFYQMLSGVAPLGESKDRSKRLNKDRFYAVKPLRQVAPRVPAPLDFIVDKAMSLDPEKRYQSPAAMLADLELAVRKLEELGTTEAKTSEEDRASVSSLSLVHNAKKSSERPVVCVVESNAELQDSFRTSLKNAGYRALVFTTAERVIERFAGTDAKVDCVLFNAQSLGANAVRGFNAMAKNEQTKDVPAILLLQETQVKWAAKALRTKWRVAVGMPITMKRILEVIRKLISDRKARLEEENPPAPPAEPVSKPEPDNEPAPADAVGDAEIPAAEPRNAEPKPAPHTGEDSFDQAFDTEADRFAEVLDANLTPPQKAAEPAPAKQDELTLYPDDEEFFFDYIDDRDLSF